VNGLGTPWVSTGHTGTRGRLYGTRRCDVAIIGAGLTGLSTAVELLELDPDLRVVVIEADHVAAGASGRGTGLLGPRVGPALSVARRRYGDDVARAVYLWSVSAVRHVLHLVERYEICCDLTPGSQLVVAPDEEAAAEQAREAEAAHALGLEIPLVQSLPEIAAGYVTGLRYTPAATLDSAALTEHLARIGEQRGLTIFERSVVRDVRPGLLTTVVTDDGAAVADHVVIATNAFSGLRTPAGVVGMRVQAGMTEKLSQATLTALSALVTEPLIGHRELTPYFRLTPDGRLVVGGGAIRQGPYGSMALIPGKLRTAVRELSPVLAEVEIESTWAGPIGVTRDGLPVVGRHPKDPQLYHAGGCNGHGLAVSVYNGAQLARWIVPGDEDGPRLPWIRPKAPWVPRGRLAARVLDRYLAHLTASSDRQYAPSQQSSSLPSQKGSR
jgi:glycine/D-amino acid oxidase-like deaminating enzyme